jgi:hypothetical protein
VIDVSGSWTLPFVASVVLLLIGSGLALRLRPDLPLVDPAVSPASARA